MAKKILLVEDEKIMINLLQKKLTQEGYDVRVAVNGEEGMENLLPLRVAERTT